MFVAIVVCLIRSVVTHCYHTSDRLLELRIVHYNDDTANVSDFDDKQIEPYNDHNLPSIYKKDTLKPVQIHVDLKTTSLDYPDEDAFVLHSTADEIILLQFEHTAYPPIDNLAFVHSLHAAAKIARYNVPA